MTLASLIARSFVTLVLGVAVYVAYRAGGGADVHPAPPRVPIEEATAASKARRARGDDAYEVRARLTEKLDEARIEVPNLKASQQFLLPHWRRMPTPFGKLRGSEASQISQSVALRVSDHELQFAISIAQGSMWTPDARVWNMNEGSFDQRECLYAPTPAMLAFRVTVPDHARFQYSAATLLNLSADTLFSVSVVDAQGREQVVHTARVQPGEAKRWVDQSVDLSAYAGQKVELKLVTSIEKARAAPIDPNAPVAPLPPMSLALWGNPVIVAKAPTTVPYNVLWFVIDALRPDVLGSFHDDDDDAKLKAARLPPLEALLPKVPGLTPHIDALGEKGARFTRAWSAASWTRPGTLAMLGGARSTELGVDSFTWLIPRDQLERYYGGDPPLLSLILRDNRVTTRAFVNNFYMIGYAAVGVEMGFERIVDHRYRTRDSDAITESATSWLREHKEERFFLFCNYNSPHDPYEPPDEFKRRIPPPPAGPSDPRIRLYMGEAAKDDDAIGAVLKALDDLDLAKNTIVVVTADHGETLSQAHTGIASLDKMPLRYHHAVSDFEETTRIPIVLYAPGKIEGGKMIKARVRSTDIAPTILDLEGLDPNPKMSGKSMMPLVRGEKEDERVVVSEGRAQRAILWDKWRLIVREGQAQFIGGYPGGNVVPEELFDMDDDPGERHSVAKERQDVVAEMRARLTAALANVPAAGTAASLAANDDRTTLRLRFAGQGRAHRVSGTITVATGQLRVAPIGVAKEAIRVEGGKIEIALTTAADGVVGLDVHLEAPGAPVTWQLFLDDKPWPDGAVYAGPFGLVATAARAGVATDEARAEVYSPALPEIDPTRDLGLFVTRDKRGGDAASGAVSSEATKEMTKMLEDWGYARGAGNNKKN